MVTYSLVETDDIIPGDPNESLFWYSYSRMDALSKARAMKKIKHKLRVIVYNRRHRSRAAREKQTGRDSYMLRIRKRPLNKPDFLTYS